MMDRSEKQPVQLNYQSAKDFSRRKYRSIGFTSVLLAASGLILYLFFTGTFDGVTHGANMTLLVCVAGIMLATFGCASMVKVIAADDRESQR